MCLIPIDLWLCEALSDWVKSLLSEELFQPKPIRKKLSSHLKSHRISLQHLPDRLMVHVREEFQYV